MSRDWRVKLGCAACRVEMDGAGLRFYLCPACAKTAPALLRSANWYVVHAADDVKRLRRAGISLREMVWDGQRPGDVWAPAWTLAFLRVFGSDSPDLDRALKPCAQDDELRLACCAAADLACERGDVAPAAPAILGVLAARGR